MGRSLRSGEQSRIERDHGSTNLLLLCPANFRAGRYLGIQIRPVPVDTDGARVGGVQDPIVLVLVIDRLDGIAALRSSSRGI